MNQENNQFNQNNFNIHANDKTSNNQTFQNTQQINPTLQSTYNYQTSINQVNIEQPTPQPINNKFNNSNVSNNNSNNNQPKRINLSLIIGGIIIIGIIIIGIILGTKFLNKNDITIKPNNNESNITDNNNSENTNIDNNDLNNEEHNRFFSINDTITSKNNYFEYTNYKWEFLFDGIDGVSVWQGTIKNISNKNLKGNLRLKFYDSNNKVIGEIQRYDLNEEVDPSNIFVLEPGEESKISFTYYSEELNEEFTLKDVKYISIEDIK